MTKYLIYCLLFVCIFTLGCKKNTQNTIANNSYLLTIKGIECDLCALSAEHSIRTVSGIKQASCSFPHAEDKTELNIITNKDFEPDKQIFQDLLALEGFELLDLVKQ